MKWPSTPNRKGLETSAGRTDLFCSRDERFIDELVDVVTTVMQREDEPFRQVFNIKNASIMNKNVTGNAFQQVQNRFGVEVAQAMAMVDLHLERSGQPE